MAPPPKHRVDPYGRVPTTTKMKRVEPNAEPAEPYTGPTLVGCPACCHGLVLPEHAVVIEKALADLAERQ